MVVEHVLLQVAELLPEAELLQVLAQRRVVAEHLARLVRVLVLEVGLLLDELEGLPLGERLAGAPLRAVGLLGDLGDRLDGAAGGGGGVELLVLRDEVLEAVELEHVQPEEEQVEVDLLEDLALVRRELLALRDLEPGDDEGLLDLDGARRELLLRERRVEQLRAVGEQDARDREPEGVDPELALLVHADLDLGALDEVEARERHVLRRRRLRRRVLLRGEVDEARLEALELLEEDRLEA